VQARLADVMLESCVASRRSALEDNHQGYCPRFKRDARKGVFFSAIATTMDFLGLGGVGMIEKELATLRQGLQCIRYRGFQI